MPRFDRPREATIQLSDVFGGMPIYPETTLPPDFDAELTAQVRNTHRFVDRQYAIGAWPEVGDYGAVLLEQLRAHQFDLAAAQNIDVHNPDPNLHPDLQPLGTIGSTALIGIVNYAPRKASHHNSGQNGDSFYVGVTSSEVEIYAQLAFFRGLAARGLVRSLHRIPNDNDVWPEGEQFRSSVVSQVRRTPDVLQPVELDKIPVIKLDGRLAYADRFGNVRLEVADVAEVSEVLGSNSYVQLLVDDKVLNERVSVVSRLTEIPENELGIYFNPADQDIPAGPAYIELIRRVSDPTNPKAHHAYETLVKAATLDYENFRPSHWEETNIQILPAA